jgi:hypothetical protein
MFEKVSRIAEQVATRASRRAFLGRLGQSALVFVGALGGLLAGSRRAEAARHIGCCQSGRCAYPSSDAGCVLTGIFGCGTPYANCQWACKRAVGSTPCL